MIDHALVNHMIIEWAHWASTKSKWQGSTLYHRQMGQMPGSKRWLSTKLRPLALLPARAVVTQKWCHEMTRTGENELLNNDDSEMPI